MASYTELGLFLENISKGFKGPAAFELRLDNELDLSVWTRG